MAWLLTRIGPFLCRRRLDTTTMGLAKLPWSWWRITLSGACTSKLRSFTVLTPATASCTFAATAPCYSKQPSTATFAVALCVANAFAASKPTGTAYSILNVVIPICTPRARSCVFFSAADVSNLFGVCRAPCATSGVCYPRAAATCSAERRGRSASG